MGLSAGLLCEVKIKVNTLLLISLGAVLVITERKLRMTDAEVRQMFVKWLKATSWHPCGLDYILRDVGDGFSEEVESIYQAYAAGIRKGMRIQKEKSNAK